MTKIHHSPHHWIPVSLALAAMLLTLSDAHGQNTGAAAVFDGRPAMAGAQGGLGAQAGPPTGGLGVQGSEAAERNLNLRRPSGLVDMPQGKRDLDPVATTKTDMTLGEVKPARDHSLAKDQRSSVKKAKRATKRVIKRSRTGVGDIDG